MIVAVPHSAGRNVSILARSNERAQSLRRKQIITKLFIASKREPKTQEGQTLSEFANHILFSLSLK